MYLNTEVVELLCNRVCDSTANTAADNSDLLEAFCLSCTAERSNEIVETFALVEVVELFCCSSYYLENNSNCTCAAVKISNSERDTLAVLISSENDELTGLCLLSDLGCSDLHKGNSRVETSFFKYFKHCLYLPKRIFAAQAGHPETVAVDLFRYKHRRGKFYYITFDAIFQ